MIYIYNISLVRFSSSAARLPTLQFQVSRLCINYTSPRLCC